MGAIERGVRCDRDPVSPIHLVTAVGARPQFVKAAAMARSLRDDTRFRHTLIHTGRHYDAYMSDVFFEELGLRRPDLNLGVGSGSHAVQTAGILKGFDDAPQDLHADLVLVFGDTNSTLAAALVAAKRGVRLAHVEAGLRSYNMAMPEEINRRLTDHVSDLLSVPPIMRRPTLAERG